MKQAIFTVVNSTWKNELNIFVESWIQDKPSDVDYILVHDGSIDPSMLNHQPDILTILPEELVDRLTRTDVHRFLKTGWQINCGRIFVMDMFKDKYDKLLYFDADTLVVDLPALLRYTPVKTIAAVEAEFTRESIEIVDKETGFGLASKVRILEQRRLNPSGYVNNGVMIINTSNLRKLPFNISELFIRTFGHLVFIDQDFINVAFSNDIEYLDRSYNLIPFPTLRDSDNNPIEYGTKSQEYFDQPLSDLKVIHYISGWRPWQPTKINKAKMLNVDRLIEIYLEVFNRTPNLDQEFRRSVKENFRDYIRK